MNKNAIKKYAVWARRELIARVTQKAEQYEITEKKITPADADSIGGRVLTTVEKKQREALIAKINQDGFEQVMEEVAYTWFNRFTSLRFMEVNNYLPSRTRVFSNEKGEFKPQILTDAISLELDGLDMDKVFELKDANRTEELYKYLLVTQCNALSRILPGMFQKLEDYTELLLPDYLLREGSVIEQMIALIPEEDWTDQVQIIGWLYQYYNTEPKDAVFAALKKNVKISKENIPAATQLFTPDWIVRYMVENSLGRLYIQKKLGETKSLDGSWSLDGSGRLDGKRTEKERIESETNIAHDMGWNYYLPEAEQEPEVQVQLAEIRKEHSALKPEEIRCIDPCMGSGHILCYLFDVLVKIYEDYGYTTREAVENIIEKNLWGLDIDERAAQLSYFAVMMKARQYDRRFFNKKDENGNPAIPQPHVYAIEESNGLDYDGDYGDFLLGGQQQETLRYLFEAFKDAKGYGSILEVEQRDYDDFLRAWDLTAEQTLTNIRMIGWYLFAGEKIVALANQAKTLSQKYHVVVTNPPYMAVGNASKRVQEYVKLHFPDSKADLFAVFIERCGIFTKKNGFQAMITQHAWMFLTSFEKLRTKIQTINLVNMVHLGARAFEEISGEVVQTTSFVFQKDSISDYTGTYCRLIKPTTQQGKEDMFLAGENRYMAKQRNYSIIPGSPVTYWVSDNIYSVFSNKLIGDMAILCQGLTTTDNNLYVRFWYEVSLNCIKFDSNNSEDAEKSRIKWFPFNKGGSFRKWYGNNELVVNYQYNGREIKANVLRKYTYLKTPDFVVKNSKYYFQEGLTWSALANDFSIRYVPCGSICADKGQGLFARENIYYYCALLNSKVANLFLQMITPTLDYNCGYVKKVPCIIDRRQIQVIDSIVGRCIYFAKNDWDSFEISWDFQSHPLAPIAYGRQEQLSAEMNSEECKKAVTLLSEQYRRWEKECEYRFSELKKNEEKLNRIFIDIYGLQDELAPEVEDKDVTVRQADLQRDIRSLMSYAVGCMFGRYSIYKPGLLFAGESYSLQTFVEKLNDQSDVITQEQLVHEYRTNGIIIDKMFEPDTDNIIPICDDEYFEDDIVGRFVEFIEIVYGKETLEENLKFIADALDGKGQPKDVIRNYFLNDFYKDHCKIYQKRPIYWLFDSGKKNGFKCLIYMHRYQPDTIARIRTDYVHEQQSRYRTAIADLEQRINGSSTSERVKLNKQLTKLQAQAVELKEYEEKIHHLADQMISIDLDDGVKVNYAKFQDVLAKI